MFRIRDSAEFRVEVHIRVPGFARQEAIKCVLCLSRSPSRQIPELRSFGEHPLTAPAVDLMNKIATFPRCRRSARDAAREAYTSLGRGAVIAGTDSANCGFPDARVRRERGYSAGGGVEGELVVFLVGAADGYVFKAGGRERGRSAGFRRRVGDEEVFAGGVMLERRARWSRSSSSAPRTSSRLPSGLTR